MKGKTEMRNNGVVIAIAFIAILIALTAISISFPSPEAQSSMDEEQISAPDLYFEEDYKYGTNPNASVHIVMFGDYQCPYTADSAPAISQLLENYGDKINFVYKHMPNFQIHKEAVLAAHAAECAGEHGKFWEYSQELFRQSNNLFYDNLVRIAAGTGLDSMQFRECMDSKKYADKIEEDIKDVIELGLRGTPTVFINNKVFEGVYDFEEYDSYIKEEMMK